MDNKNLLISILVSAFFYWLTIKDKSKSADPITVDFAARDSIKSLQSRINNLETKFTNSPFAI